MRRSILSSRTFVSLALLLGVALFDTNTASAQQVTVVSSTSDGSPGNDESSRPSISADGRFVAFTSRATNLVPGDTNTLPDVFVKDRVSGAISRVSVTTSGQQFGFGGDAARISADGRFVVFDTISAGVPDDTTACATHPVVPCTDVYVPRSADKRHDQGQRLRNGSTGQRQQLCRRHQCRRPVRAVHVKGVESRAQ